MATHLRYSVREITSGTLIMEAIVCEEGDAVAVLTLVPYEKNAHRMYSIKWQSELGTGKNHYLAGTPPFDAKWDEK